MAVEERTAQVVIMEACIKANSITLSTRSIVGYDVQLHCPHSPGMEIHYRYDLYKAQVNIVL